MATSSSSRTDKILVVDDDARIRDLLRRYLTRRGLRFSRPKTVSHSPAFCCAKRLT